MPTFVLFAMKKAPQVATVDRTPVTLGRDASCDIVLPGDTISRHHAVVERDRAGQWTIRCVSATNPIVVNGALTTSSAQLSEGDEVLLGTEYLVVFSENETRAAAYVGRDSYFARSQCSKCGWTGMVSALRREPVCPRCGGRDLVALNVYRKETAAHAAVEGETRAISGTEVRASLQRLKEAKRSRIERLDGLQDRQARKELSESEPCRIGKETDATFRLHGFTLGGGVTIRWSGTHFVAESAMLFPAMRVNGRKEKMTSLRPGDLIEIGRNRFRFVTEG